MFTLTQCSYVQVTTHLHADTQTRKHNQMRKQMTKAQSGARTIEYLAIAATQCFVSWLSFARLFNFFFKKNNIFSCDHLLSKQHSNSFPFFSLSLHSVSLSSCAHALQFKFGQTNANKMANGNKAMEENKQNWNIFLRFSTFGQAFWIYFLWFIGSIIWIF